MDSFGWFIVLVLQAVFVWGSLIGSILSDNPDLIFILVIGYPLAMLITFLIMSFKLVTETKVNK